VAKVPIAGQIAEVQRELALRANAYPRLVGSGKMRQGEADLCMRRMEAVLATLAWCQDNEAEIRAIMAERKARDA
jgi:hypothetical protein